jgi:hypothetical protein
MHTPSHFIMTLAARKALRKKADIPLSAAAWGSLIPDIAIYALSVAGYIHFVLFEGMTLEAASRHMFQVLFYEDTIWLVLQNCMQSLVVISAGLIFVHRSKRLKANVRRWLWWCLWAMMIHTWIDIFTHADDGPLLFFPLSWSYRFESPVSYWDVNYHAGKFMWFEFPFDAACVLYLLIPRLVNACKLWSNQAREKSMESQRGKKI